MVPQVGLGAHVCVCVCLWGDWTPRSRAQSDQGWAWEAEPSPRAPDSCPGLGPLTPHPSAPGSPSYVLTVPRPHGLGAEGWGKSSG